MFSCVFAGNVTVVFLTDNSVPKGNTGFYLTWQIRWSNCDGVVRRTVPVNNLFSWVWPDRNTSSAVTTGWWSSQFPKQSMVTCELFADCIKLTCSDMLCTRHVAAADHVICIYTAAGIFGLQHFGKSYAASRRVACGCKVCVRLLAACCLLSAM